MLLSEVAFSSLAGKKIDEDRTLLFWQTFQRLLYRFDFLAMLGNHLWFRTCIQHIRHVGQSMTPVYFLHDLASAKEVECAGKIGLKTGLARVEISQHPWPCLDVKRPH